MSLGGFHIGEVESWGSVEELHIREVKFQIFSVGWVAQLV